MATTEWGMLRDIFAEVAAEHFAAADALPPPINPTVEARLAVHLELAQTFRRVAETMRERGGMTPDELYAGAAAMAAEMKRRRGDGND